MIAPVLQTENRTDYRMIESVDIENFRCFESVHLSNLKRVNVIVGRNGSGKTALLEAMFLAGGGHPEIVLRFRNWRGMGGFSLAAERETYEAIWKDLFYKLDQSRQISISLKGSKANTRFVKIHYGGRQALIQPTQDAASPTVVFPITFAGGVGTEETFSTQPRVEGDQFKVDIPVDVMMAYFIAATTSNRPLDAAERFSDLSKKNKEYTVVEALREEFPFIKGLSVEINGAVPMVFASVTYLDEKIPLGLVSAGINKLLLILLAIAHKREGVVFIDELENGFYHDKLTSIWSLLLKFARDQESQVFVTTHSREAIGKLLPVISGNEDDFCLLRVRNDDNGATVRRIDGLDFRSAIEEHVEVR